MNVWRTRAARIALMVGLCGWVAGLFSSLIHEVLVEHVVCPEHGEIIELGDGTAHAETTTDGPELFASDAPADHEHGCLEEILMLEGMQVVTLHLGVPTDLVWPAPPVLAIRQAPRGPPLSYAPKTSPPTASS